MTTEIPCVNHQCNMCKTIYESKEEAAQCESKPISQDRGIKIGDLVMITEGDGTGALAKVKRTYILSMGWGHYAAQRYWHTVALEADICDSWGTRLLTFDSYRKV